MSEIHLHSSEDDARMADVRDAIAILLGVEQSRLRVVYDDRPGADGLCTWSFQVDGREVSTEQENQIASALRRGLRTPTGLELRWLMA